MTKYTTMKVISFKGEENWIILEEGRRTASHVYRTEAAAQQEANRRTAVNKAIAASNRAGRRIGGREARMIQALLSGRTK